MKKPDKVPTSRSGTTRKRKPAEHVQPSKETKSNHSQGCTISTSDSSSGSQSWYRSLHEELEEPMHPDDVDESCRGEQASRDEGLAPEPAGDFYVFVPGTNKKHESGWEADGDFSDCEIFGVDSYTPPQKRYKFKHSNYDSDEEMDNCDPYPDKHGSEGRETPILETCSEDFFETKSPPRKHKEKIPGISPDDVGKSHSEKFQQTENSRDTSTESSEEDDLLYYDEVEFHDAIVREPKGETSKLHEVFREDARSGVDISRNSRAVHDTRVGHDNKTHDSRNRLERKTAIYEVVSVPEVDRVFMGPKWKTFDPRLRVKTILDQFQYLVNFYRLAAATKEKTRRLRPDIQAGKYMMAKRFCFNEGWSIVGNIPGVEVGDIFTCREQLLILIVHRTSQAGIEYIPTRKSGYVDKNGNPVSVAVSIVSAGGYKDNEDDGDTLTYVGSGGEKNLTCSRGPADNTVTEKDQELVRGNLALKNSCDLGVPVRVIRGEKCADGESLRKTYWYDGLYNVMKYYEVVGSAGSKVWKFQLVKQKGQRES